MSMTIRGSSSTMRIERPSREGRCIRDPVARQSASCQRQGGLVSVDRGCPEVTINPHIATRRDDRLGRQSPQSWGGLGAAWCLLILQEETNPCCFRLVLRGNTCARAGIARVRTVTERHYPCLSLAIGDDGGLVQLLHFLIGERAVLL